MSGLIVQRPMATLRGGQGLVYLRAATRLREVKNCTHGHTGREAAAGLYSPPCPLRAHLCSSAQRRLNFCCAYDWYITMPSGTTPPPAHPRTLVLDSSQPLTFNRQLPITQLFLCFLPTSPAFSHFPFPPLSTFVSRLPTIS